ncbi:MAG: ABC transporter permease [Planctomycetes bacterium]|nr:ABC transporter permease [Planctomycetota bacterium]
MSDTLDVYQTYSAESSPRGFLYHAIRFPNLVRVVFGNPTLTAHFFGSTLVNRFRGSFLGSTWVLIHPLFLFLVYFAVFSLFLDRSGSGDTLRFALYLFSGIVCFHAIVNGTTQALTAATGNADLIRKVSFPSEILPVVPVFVEVAVALVGIVLVMLIAVPTGRASIGWDLLALPWFVVAMTAFASGLGLLLANLNVFVRDVRNLYTIIATPWFFLSPNFWWPQQIAGQKQWMLDVLSFNPAYHLLIAERQVLGLVVPGMGITGSVWHNLAIASLWALVFLIVGYGSYMVHRDKHADLV